MDICVLNPFFYPYKGGTEKVLLEIYKRLAKRHNITVLTSGKDGCREHREELFGINVVRLKTKYMHIPDAPLPFLLFDGINKTIKRAGADIYHINNRFQYFPYNIKTIKSVGKLALTIHNSLPIDINTLTDTVGLLYDVGWGRTIMKEADIITGVSKNAIEVTVPEREMYKAHVIYNGVDYNNFRKISKKDRTVASLVRGLGFEGPTVVSNGRLVPQKGQIYLMIALHELAKMGTDVNLLIIGCGPMQKELTERARSLGLSGRFAIRHGIGDDKLPYYYAVGDITVLPSLYEPASLAALESMACEVPLIVSRVGGLPEMVGKCGLYTEPRDHIGIMNGIEELLENKQKASDLARRGRARVISRHSLDRISKKYEELFLNTIRA
jgi:glycosyltransferase involved in cell wall biosynthesis